MNLNLTLRSMRQQLRLSLRNVEAHTSIARSTISDMELGKTDCGFKKMAVLKAFYEAELQKRGIVFDDSTENTTDTEDRHNEAL